MRKAVVETGHKALPARGRWILSESNRKLLEGPKQMLCNAECNRVDPASGRTMGRAGVRGWGSGWKGDRNWELFRTEYFGPSAPHTDTLPSTEMALGEKVFKE